MVGQSGTLLKAWGPCSRPPEATSSWGETELDGDHWLNPDLTRLGRQQIGFIFQSPNLLPFLNVRDNVALLAMLLGSSNQQVG